MTAMIMSESDGRPPARQRMPHGPEVDIWIEWLDRASTDEADWILGRDERARADVFRFERDRRRFLARRIFVRRVLARYTGLAPGQVAFSVTAAGRPELDGVGDISFNASHADGLAVLAVAHRGPVGIDVERMRQLEDAMALARSFFSAREVQRLEAVPSPRRSEAFLTMWTRKEALVKAMGGGLSIPLDSFDISARDSRTGQPIGSDGKLPYTFADVNAADGYLAAVTLRGSELQPRLQQAARQ